MDWMERERFPDDTRFIWVTVENSECERQLRAHWRNLEQRGPTWTCELIGTPSPDVLNPRDKHTAIASLYNLAFERIAGDHVLLIEDDVIASAGAVQRIIDSRLKLPGDTAAVMATYRSRVVPESICASDARGHYHPWPKGNRSEWIECEWIGGGFTLYQRSWIERCRPVFMEERGGRISGWDVNLCRKIKEGGGRLFVDPAIRGEHRCSEVLSYCRKHGQAVA
jgi:hypothetical protein